MSYHLRDIIDQTIHMYAYHLIVMTGTGGNHFAVDGLIYESQSGEYVGVREQNGEREVVVQFSKHLPYMMVRREDMKRESEADEMEYALNQIAKRQIFDERVKGLIKPQQSEGNEEWR